MKKTFLLIGCVVLLAIGVVSISCKKDEKSNNGGLTAGCVCTVTGPELPNGKQEYSIPKLALDMAGVTCAQYKSWFLDLYEEYTEDGFAVTCK